MAPETNQGSPDRRRHARYELIAQVHVRQAKSDYVLELRNISHSGALVVLGSLARPTWIDVDRMVELAIVNPVTLDSVDVRARVVRVQRESEGLIFAVEFVSLTPELQHQIDELTRLGKPSPPPLPLGTPARQPPPLPPR
jgi:c-di-GMP-binding flagellar brake protein YcgR